MGRRHYSKPKVHRSAGKDQQWYFRPSIPVRDHMGNVTSHQTRVWLGSCKAMTKREAEKLRDEYCNTLNRTPVMVQGQIRLAELIEAYDRAYLPTLSANSQQMYRWTFDKYVLPAFGNSRLCEIGPEEVQCWLNGIQGTRRSKQSHLSRFSSVFEAAGKWGYTQQRNPCRGIRIAATAPERSRDVPEPHELQRAILLAEEPYRTAIEVALFCGLRIGEIRALTRAAVLPPWLHITRQRRVRGGELSEPKRGSVRKVPLPGWLAERLLALRPADQGLLFPTDYETMRRALRDCLERAGIYTPGMSWHRLRAAFATYRDETGGEQLQRDMGHKSASMTEGYIRPGLRRRLAELDRMRELIMFSGEEGGVQ